MTTTPKPAVLDSQDAEMTTTPIAAYGVHPVTERLDHLYFRGEGELKRYLSRNKGAVVFDLNRKTGEWFERP